MRLKWLPVRLRRRRGVPSDRGCSPRTARAALRLLCTSAGSRPTTVVSRPRRASRVGGSAFARGTYSPAPGRSGDDRGELRVSHVAAQAPPRGGWAAPVRQAAEAVTAPSVAVDGVPCRPGGGPVAPCAAVVGARMAASDPS